MLPPQLQTLIAQFEQLPGIGPRQAARFAFHLMRNEEQIPSLAGALELVRNGVYLCQNCHMPAHSLLEANEALCSICLSPGRDKNIICLVEKETDALNFEKSGYFKGQYYILGGFVNPLEEMGLPQNRIAAFLNRIKKYPQGAGMEFILAFSPRREGDFTSSYVESKLKEEFQDGGRKLKITRLGRGLSTGAELEYADRETIKNALEGRR